LVVFAFCIGTMPAKKVDPEDGVAYTFDEIAAHYKGKFKKKEIDAYWEDTCAAKGKAKAKAKSKVKAEPEPKAKAKAKAKVKAKAKPKVKEDAAPVKLHYFPLKARGFPALLALEVGNVNYEAVKVEFADWGALKASGKFPFDYMAGLELADGTMINETNAILFTIGHIARSNGGSNKDFGISTMLACKAAEVFTELTKAQPTIGSIKDWDAAKAKALEEWKPKADAHLDHFEKLCGDDGKFTKSGKTTGELHLYSVLYHMRVSKFKTEFSPKLTKFIEQLEALDGVKKCIENKTKFGELGDYVLPVP